MIPSSQARILSGVKAFYKYLLMEDIIKSDPIRIAGIAKDYPQAAGYAQPITILTK